MADEMENGTGMPEEHPDHSTLDADALQRHMDEAHGDEADAGSADVVPAPEEDDDMDMGGGTEPKPVDAPEDDEEAV